MTPPGDGLEFHATPDFKARAARIPGLHEAVGQFLRNQPNAGIPVAGAFRELTLLHDGGEYVVFFTRKRNATGLTSIFDANDTVLLERRRRSLKELFGGTENEKDTRP